MLRCQVFLALTQTAFVLGAVYFKYSAAHVRAIGRINPVVFAFIREATAGSVMCALAYLSSKAVLKREDFPKIAFLGTLLYMNQLFYIMGVELSGVVVATCMQPAIPVFTVALAMTLGKEEPSLHKTLGIVLASAGSICMVSTSSLNRTNEQDVAQVAGGGLENNETSAVGSNALFGNFLLFLNTIAMALYYIYAKPVLSEYPPMSVAAWAYVCAAFDMGLTALWYNRFYQHQWNLPTEAYGPLIYWIVVCSVCGYYIIAWAMKHLPSTQVAAFQCLQPPIGTVLGFMILGEALTVWDFGALGVLLGLMLVNRKPRPESRKSPSLPKIEVQRLLTP